MLEIKFLRQNLSEIHAGLAKRGAESTLDSFSETEKKRREILARLETLRHERNAASEEIARMKKNKEDAEDKILAMRQTSADIKDLEKSLGELDEQLQAILMAIPNVPHPSVPEGKDDSENRLEKSWGTPKNFEFLPKAHWELGENLGILDFERAARITGARFALYLGAGSRLERALINFMLDIHTEEHGYTETIPPFLVNRKAMTGTGQLPKFESDLFHLDGPDYFLIPTAEVPVTNMHSDEILSEEDLPLYYTAYTPCFRSEAGSYGKDTRGLIRLHQFNKVELVKFSLPETSWDELESLLKQAETILQRLELPYRVVTLCAGDLGFSSAKTYDIEVWMPGQDAYREISSCSNFEDYQARRANIRFKRKGKKGTELVHTLNGSGLAVGRTFAAILENYQNPDGSIRIPEALQPYMGGMKLIEK
ncbi:seryl-tRNA synthetase [Desulfobotulus alkaliphilus]|uniref:Serine--tRNA ligase n=1 Tax=Desulfobotulus alkaliphilus TaxID=622671 RepID=A0A562RC99_9BACT|nr:serine--tRNA ligase [Desulfobotulus alkaliphilus]TWI66060.1 seryl-tRNA synthetase [Desulfobotulus alkaliphilus]